MSPEIRSIIVVLDDEASARASEIADLLRGAGMDVRSVLEEVGIVLGEAPLELLARLALVHGVSEVREEGGVAIAPPDSETQ